MSKAVLISIRPEWCAKIASGEKTIDVRKTRPKLPTPFKCYIYCTNPKDEALWRYEGVYYYDTQFPNERPNTANGLIIGEFVCDRIVDWPDEIAPPVPLKDCCMTYSEVRHYGGAAETLYLWHISDLKIYDEPKELSEFYRREKVPHGAICAEDTFLAPIYSPPQSWCYCEVLT